MLRRASADAESELSLSDDISDGEMSSSTLPALHAHQLLSRKRKAPSRSAIALASAVVAAADEDELFGAGPLKRSKYAEALDDEDEDSLLSDESDEAQSYETMLDKRHPASSTSSAANATGPSQDFSAFSALVDASCEVLQQQQQVPTLVHLVHPGLYAGPQASFPFTAADLKNVPVAFLPTFAY